MTDERPIDELVNQLIARAPEFTIKGFAMMSYNPAIGRVLEKGGVDKFRAMAWEHVQRLTGVRTPEEYDNFHDAFVAAVRENLRTNKGEELSYGQAQKPVNVFMKVLVLFANLPTRESASTLKPFLHVPLDSVVMEYFQSHYPADYRQFIMPVIEDYRTAAKAGGSSVTLPDRLFLDLRSVFNKDHYYAWQRLFRALYPKCPVLLDFVWSVNRDAA
ncbi:MAG: hypothetical protein Q8O40_05865 [Chloroflexota bacterium]|nr:hypothetical protein [Chloroflexota bacterium]